MKVVNLIFGLICAAGIPLGLLKLAILWADKQEKKSSNDVRVSKSDSRNSGR